MKYWQTSKRLLLLAGMVQEKVDELEQCGVNVPQLEYTVSEILMTILQLNGISRNDDSVDYLVQPLLEFLWGKCKMVEGLKELEQRLLEMRQSRLGGVSSGTT